MTILLFGKTGQLGWELQRSLAPLAPLVALSRHSTEYPADFLHPQALAETVRRVQPSVIVNAAAYTAVDQAESEPDVARIINAEAPAALAKAAAECGAWLVHYSTDYVFDGEGSQPWQETDLTAPLNVYGETKLAGEMAIAASGCRHLIFRTSWVYGPRGGNFARTMLRLAAERDTLSVVNDQFGAPTGADLLADLSAQAIRSVTGRPELGGLYHVAPQGEASWFDYARYVLQVAHDRGVPLKAGPDDVQPVPSKAYPTPARRPGNSLLNTTKFRQSFGLHLPEWHVGVERLIDEITGN